MPQKEEESITPFQFFALSYLFSEELKKAEKEQYIDDYIRKVTHHSYSSVMQRSISVTVRELAIKMPISMNEKCLTTPQMLNELWDLESKQYLERASIGGDRGEFTSFSATTDGIVFVKHIFSQMSGAFKDKVVYEKTIEKVEGSGPVKAFLKGLFGKLQDKAQDEIANMILSGVKKYGPELIGAGFRLLNEYMKTPPLAQF